MTSDTTQDAEFTPEVDAADAAASQEEPKSEPERYPVEELIANASLMLDGASRHALAGALASETRKTLTIEQAKSAVDKFLNREVS